MTDNIIEDGQMVKEEDRTINQNEVDIDDANSNSIKKESSQDIRTNQNIERRWGFDICKQDSDLAVHVPEIQELPNQEKAQNAEEFKRFLLACIWEKRISKNEIIMMNLVQNIKTLSQAVKDDTIPLKQALKILMGLQKVYQRKMAYLFDDSQNVLNQISAPFQIDGIKGESSEVQITKTKQQKRRKEGEIPGLNPQTMKLDLKNSKWWNTGFNNTYLQQQLTRFLIAKQEESMPQMTPMQMGIEVRGAEAQASPFNVDRSQIDGIQMDMKSNIRYQEQDQPGIGNMLQGIENEIDGIFESPMPGDLAAESPRFDDKPYQLLNAFSKLDEKELTKQVFGEKTFDFANLEPEIQIGNIAIPKDDKRRKNFEKQMLTIDHNLDGKVQRLKEQLKQSTNKTVRFDEPQLNLQMKLLNLNEANSTKDPLAEIFHLDESAQTGKKNDTNFGQLVHQSAHLQKFLGISPSYEILDESALFGTPENMEIDNQFDVFMANAEDPGSAPYNYGEDLNNDEVFKDALESPIAATEPVEDQKHQNTEMAEENIENNADQNNEQNLLQTRRQEELMLKLQSMDAAPQTEAEDVETQNSNLILISKHGQKVPLANQSSKLQMVENLMDLMMLQKQQKVNLDQDRVSISNNSGSRKVNFAQIEIRVQ